MTRSKVILVTKQSTWEQYLQNQSAFGRLSKQSLAKIKASHKRQTKAVAEVLTVLEKLHVKPWIIDGAGTTFSSHGARLVITLGGDGTLLSASHYIGSQTPLLGINSDPALSLGHFCAVSVEEKGATVELARVIEQSLDAPDTIEVDRMAVSVGRVVVSKRVLNEALFSHTCPAAMTRFLLSWAEGASSSKVASSGIWIGTGAGSTGAIASAGGHPMSMDCHQLQGVIRENSDPSGPHPMIQSASFSLVSKVADATIYLDGPFLRIPVSFDEKTHFKVSDEPLRLVKKKGPKSVQSLDEDP